MPINEAFADGLTERGTRLASNSRVLLTSTSSDAHTWNLVFLQLLMTEHGHEVHNLGACVPVELLVSEPLRIRPDMLVLSSVNGHGLLDGRRAIRAIRRVPALDAVLAVLGGKLTTNGALSTAQWRALRSAGFDAVFTGDTAVERFRRLLTPAAAPAATA